MGIQHIIYILRQYYQLVQHNNVYHTYERMASFKPLAFELEAKEICPHPQQERLLDLTVLPFFWQFQLWPFMHCSSHFNGQKWNRVIDLSWNDATLLFTSIGWNISRRQDFPLYKLLIVQQKEGSVCDPENKSGT